MDGADERCPPSRNADGTVRDSFDDDPSLQRHMASRKNGVRKNTIDRFIPLCFFPSRVSPFNSRYVYSKTLYQEGEN
jgi:hypothetical protein